MARRRAPEPASGSGEGLLMPAEIAIYRPDDWSSSRDHAAAARTRHRRRWSVAAVQCPRMDLPVSVWRVSISTGSFAW